jgi:DNA-directed RNA polymerase subunit beta'
MRAIVEGGEVIESLRDRILGRTAADDIFTQKTPFWHMPAYAGRRFD